MDDLVNHLGFLSVSRSKLSSALRVLRRIESDKEINKKVKTHPILEFWKKAGSVKTSKGQELMESCLDCKLEYDGILETMLRDKNFIAKQIQDFACLELLPKNFTPSCEDFLSMYLPTVLDLTIKQFSGDSICEKKQCCSQQSLVALAAVSVKEQKELALKSCAHLQSFIAEHFAGTEMRVNAIATAHEQFCDRVPSVLHNICYRATEAIVPKFLHVFASLAAQGHYCGLRGQ